MDGPGCTDGRHAGDDIQIDGSKLNSHRHTQLHTILQIKQTINGDQNQIINQFTKIYRGNREEIERFPFGTPLLPLDLHDVPHARVRANAEDRRARDSVPRRPCGVVRRGRHAAVGVGVGLGFIVVHHRRHHPLLLLLLQPDAVEGAAGVPRRPQHLHLPPLHHHHRSCRTHT